MTDSGRIQSFELFPVKKRINLLSNVLYFGHTSPLCFGVFSYEIIKIYPEIMADSRKIPMSIAYIAMALVFFTNQEQKEHDKWFFKFSQLKNDWPHYTGTAKRGQRKQPGVVAPQNVPGRGLQWGCSRFWCWQQSKTLPHQNSWCSGTSSNLSSSPALCPYWDLL